MNTDPDRSGQAGALTVLTPIAPGAEPALREYLEGCARRRARWPAWSARTSAAGSSSPTSCPTTSRPDRLTGPYLLFTASFDGPLDTYLDELCDELAAEAQEIWGRCAAAPQPPAGAPLKAYLRAHHQTTGFFVAAYPDATVGQVRAALAQREDVIAFARAAQGMDPAHLQAAFLQRIGG